MNKKRISEFYNGYFCINELVRLNMTEIVTFLNMIVKIDATIFDNEINICFALLELNKYCWK